MHKVERKVEKNPLTFCISQRIITVMCINHLRFANVECGSDTRDGEHTGSADEDNGAGTGRLHL